MHTKILTYSRYQGHVADYWRSDWTPWLCCRRLKNHAELPEGCSKVRLVSTQWEPDGQDYWDIKVNGKLTGVRTELTCHFQRWLMSNYCAGDRYVYLEIVE